MFDLSLYSTKQEEKDKYLLNKLNELTKHHYKNCSEYKNIVDNIYKKNEFDSIYDIPYLPVSLFKRHELLSTDKSNIVRVLTSSGTTGQQVSKIFLDNETTSLQSKALVYIMSSILGTKRMPMIIIDTKDVFKNKNSMSARGAGIAGMMNFGSKPFFALNEDMSLDIDGLVDFLNKNGNSRFFMFGFTYMVWCHFFEQIKTRNLYLGNGILVHSGGWKKMLEKSVNNEIFKKSLNKYTGLSKIYNFYGMVEQVGSVYLEGDDGYLYPPSFSDIIVRDIKTMKPAKIGEVGIVQVVSCLPKSYPGHSILTEDLGVIHHIDKDTCGKMGKAFSIIGRIPKSEIRGCSDTYKELNGSSI